MLLKFIKLIILIFFSFMLAVCIVMGVAVVIPKRKEETVIEIEITKPDEINDTTVLISDFKTIP